MAQKVTCPKCGSRNCERFAESDAPPDGANTICGECGELFSAVHLRFEHSRAVKHIYGNDAELIGVERI